MSCDVQTKAKLQEEQAQWEGIDARWEQADVQWEEHFNSEDDKVEAGV
jgi:hypothetical protein